MAAVFAGAGSVTAMAETADAAAVETQAESQAAKPAPTEFAHITSCEVTGGNQVSIKGQMEGSWSDPAYYDNYLYLFEMKPYQRDLKGRTDYAAWITKGDELSFQLPLNHGTQEDRLYSSFVVAVYDGSEYTIVSNEAYVANPESVAKYTDPYKTAQTKKGLLIQTTPAMLSDAFSLGVNHVIVNIPFNHILGSGIDYEYDGKTYHFNKDVLAVYDDTIKRMSEKDMTVTAVILNGWNDSTPQLYYPGVTKQPASVANYYGFHVATEEGYESLRAIAAFLADRYGSKSSPYGRVSNWVIGNEINNQLWNYMGPMSLEKAQNALYKNGQPKYWYASAYVLIANTGIRSGEALALTWDNVNLRTKTLTICQNASRIKKRDSENATGSKQIITSTKSRSGTRQVPLNSKALAALARLRELQEHRHIQSQFVICTSTGKMVVQNSFYRIFQNMQKSLGIKPVTIHALRHTFATQLIKANVDIKVISQLLGHSSVKITYDTYVHTDLDRAFSAVQSLE